MCIIAVKPQGVETPSKEILKNMFDANPHGAGIAYNSNGKLNIIKGLMTFEEFWQACQKISKENGAIYHTRIETSGGICKELTHPFLITNDIKKQRQLHIETTYGEAVAHNGVFGEFKFKENENDTTQFISTYLAPLQKAKWLADRNILDDDFELIINKLCDSSNKLAIINQSGQIKRYGKNWIFDNGIYYSNHTYQTPQRTYSHHFYRPLTCLSWEDKTTEEKIRKSIHAQVKRLRNSDPDFEMVYQRWNMYMSEEELLDCYENGWV